MLCESIKSLKLFTSQEMQALQKAVVKRFKTIERIIKIDEQGEKVQRQDLTLPVPVRVRNDITKILAT